jgi:hypothetical protein
LWRLVSTYTYREGTPAPPRHAGAQSGREED